MASTRCSVYWMWPCWLAGHTTTPRRDGEWYATWRCSRCGKDLRKDA